MNNAIFDARSASGSKYEILADLATGEKEAELVDSEPSTSQQLASLLQSVDSVFECRSYSATDAATIGAAQQNPNRPDISAYTTIPLRNQ